MMKSILGVIIALSVSTTAFGWGQTGHRAIGKIAENHLTEKAKQALKEIMGHESLAESSTWMDEVKSDKTYNFAKTWHYVTVPKGKDYHSAEHEEKGDAYEAIGRMEDILKNLESTKTEKIEAIRMLAHLVGDIHQPLHVGTGEDRGGNNVKIKWFYEDSNLHRIWDSGMIEEKKMSFSEIAELVDHPTDGISQVVASSTDLDVWVKEAVELRPQVYDIGDRDYLSYEYMYKNWSTVKVQLYKGGVRLAQILKDIYE
jgi:hypothetical protein